MTPMEKIGNDVGDLRVTAARIEGAVTSLASTIAEVKAAAVQLDQRIDRLERWRYQMMGASAVLGAIGAWLFHLVAR